MILAVLWLVTLSNLVGAQQPGRMEPGILRVKLTEQLARQLESATVTRTPGNVLMTGIRSLDLVNEQYKVTSLRRVFREGGKFEARHRRYGLHLWYEIRMDQTAVLPAALEAYRGVTGIQHVEPSYKKAIIGADRQDFGFRRVDADALKSAAATLPGASNDPLLDRQWHYNNTGQAGGSPDRDIALFRAWGLTTGTPNVVVAVTDGGAQVDHPDLAANMWVNTDEIPGNSIDDDNNGYVDDINGYGFGDDTGFIAPDNHGTHTSGTIAAVTNNGIGVAGVAGGSGAGDGVRIMSCAAFGANDNAGFELTYVYGADNGAVISQNSWGYTNAGDVEQVVLDAIDYFIAEAGKDENGNQVGPMNGGIVIFAAGNSNRDDQWYPGYYEPTLTVSALNNKDVRSYYSNFGTWVDIAAPGGETLFANAPQGVLSTIANNGYAFLQGTSMACPHVSGVAALLVSKFGGPGFTPTELRQRLTERVTDVNGPNPSYAGKLGSGKVNAFAALSENDAMAPAAITDLRIVDSTFHSLTIAWTAPADANNGAAWEYEVTYGNFDINPGTMQPFHANNPPAPAPPGTLQSMTIPRLDPAQRYQITMRSKDFFGNASAVSATSGTTGYAPVFSMKPPFSTAVTVQTGQITSVPTTIKNLFGEDLTFTIVKRPGGTDQVGPDVVSDTLAAGDSVIVNFIVDAHNMLPGSYPQIFDILTNEPFVPSHIFILEVTVISNGASIATVQPDSLAFGPVFLSSSKTQAFTIHNDGAEPLVITSITSSNPVFTIDFTGSDTLTAFATDTVHVAFTPTALTAESGVITIVSNDPANPSIGVGLSGEGIPAPVLEVAPSSLSATLNTGGKETQTLTVSNTGGSDLNYAVTVLPDFVSTQAIAKRITLPARTAASTGRSLRQTGGGQALSRSSIITIKSVRQTAAVSNVLILSPDDDLSDLEAILDSFDDIEADVFPNTALPGLTVAALSSYDVVLTTNNATWASAEVDPARVGDVLADYVDDGGKVITNAFAYSYDAWRLEGRFIDEQYGPFTPATGDGIFDVRIGAVLLPGHPLLAGVDSLRYVGYVQNMGLAPGASAIARWDNGDLVLAANSRVVSLNLLPAFGDVSGFPWLGDLPTLYQNAIHYLRTSSVIEVAPVAGTVPGGGQEQLQATFNATGLDSGVYHANIHITSNAPQQPLVIVPATLTVKGAAFKVSPTALSVALEKDQTVSQTLVLSNNTGTSQNYTVSISGGLATVEEDQSPPAVKPRRVSTAARTGRSATAARKSASSNKQAVSLEGQTSGRMALSAAAQSSVSQYATDFESFVPGDINGQQGWFGLFANWTVEAENPFGGAQHFRGLADGFGFTGAVTPGVAIGAEPKSTLTLKANVQGTGVTWQIVPQSPSTGFVNTRIQFGPDGIITALTDDGADGVFQPIGATPSGYFDLTIEIDRDSAYFHVFVNDQKVFTGQGYAGSIEEVAILSEMEIGGPTLDIDNLQIFDGAKEAAPEFITVAPSSGTLPAGSSVALNVTFSSEDLDFGNYSSSINIAIGGTTLRVPASLRVFGDPAIEVSPTVLQDTLAYQEESFTSFEIRNTGGEALTYSLQVVGAGTNVNSLKPGPVAKAQTAAVKKRIADKQTKDDARSKVMKTQSPPLQLLAGAPVFQENFDNAFPPAGWTTVDNEGNGVVWATAAHYGYGNFAGTGEAATVSSDEAGVAEFDAELISPTIQTGGYSNIVLQYNANYQNLANADFLDLDIQVNGGAWVNVLRWNEDHGDLFGLPGETVTVPLQQYLGRTPTSFRLRWHYYDPNTDDWDWYAQIDDVSILGDARAWLYVDPTAGVVPIGGATTIATHFDAIDLAPGFYVGGILVSSNAASSPTGVLATLKVIAPNAPPVLATIEPVEVAETNTQQVTFTATDADQEPVTVELQENLAFITKTSSSNGQARYTIAPKLGDSGEYDLPVIATDARGLTDSTVFHLSVVAYGVESFSLRNVRTNTIIATFEDSVTLDITDPVFSRLAFRANTNPTTVGSVKFWLDGHTLNTANSKPYELTPLALLLLNGGEHTLKAQAYTKANAKGTKGKALEARIRVINSSAVTSFDVVRSNGAKVMTLTDNAVIDISKSALRSINIRANISGSAVQSVVFKLNGRLHRVDNDDPYVLHGNLWGIDTPWPATPGWYTLEATPYSGWFGLGVAGTPVTIRFRVINGSSGHNNMAAARAADDDDIASAETDQVNFSIYPVPVKDELRIAIPAETQGHVRLLIHDAQGKARFTDDGDAERFYDYTVSTEDLKMGTGFYFVQVQYGNGKREVRKVVKE